MRLQSRKPFPFFFDLCNILGSAWKPDRKRVSKPKGSIVPAIERYGSDWKRSPARKLLVDQAASERGINDHSTKRIKKPRDKIALAVALYIARVTLGLYTYKVRILFRSNKPGDRWQHRRSDMLQDRVRSSLISPRFALWNRDGNEDSGSIAYECPARSFPYCNSR